jgi:hypothetical protein
MISAKETIGKGGFGCVTWTFGAQRWHVLELIQLVRVLRLGFRQL